MKSEVDHQVGENQVDVTRARGFWMQETEVTQSDWERVTDTASVVPVRFNSCPAKVPEKGAIVVPVKEPLSAANPHAAGVW